ncbi:MAG TPA: flagellar type III secretion system pore protein FliP [Alphaproteobacteria bacterium]|nr:flagellar type III secretion system pore protein FliP [Alphaproteobacteria bacterium]
MRLSSFPLRRIALILTLAALFLPFLAGSTSAQDVSINFADQASLTQRIVQLVVLMTVLSVAPSILIMVTSFVRIVVVLSMVRMAMGVQSSPPNMVIISLAMFLTAFVMAPTVEKAYSDAYVPWQAGTIKTPEAFEKATAPFKTFMLKQVREKDLSLFFNLTKAQVPKDPQATPLQILIPAFMISELRRAFEIGFLIFVPFLIIDLVVASVLMAMGMMMLPPIVISLPFKLIFFVLVDGWYLVCGSLVESFK